MGIEQQRATAAANYRRLASVHRRDSLKADNPHQKVDARLAAKIEAKADALEKVV